MSPSTIINHQLSVSLTIQGRFVTASSSQVLPGIDVAVSTTHDNRLLLPFSLVKGKLRESLSETADGLTWTDQWLLERQDSTSDRQRGRIRFSDFKSDVLTEPIATEIRTAIDAKRRSVKEGMMLTFQSPIPAGDVKTFYGTVEFAASENEANTVCSYLTAGLRLITHFGANGSVGFGRLLSVVVDKSARTTNEPQANAQPSGSRVYFSLRPESSFCISKSRIADNSFESENEISGAVLKGVLASMINAASGKPSGSFVDESNAASGLKTLAKHLGRICCVTAKPVADANGSDEPAGATGQSVVLPVVPPLSLVKYSCQGAEQSRDVALQSGPVAFVDQGRNVAPQFQIDWKDDSDVRKDFAIPRVTRELRVRTAIDPGKRRASDGQLFAYQMIRPDRFRWVGAIDLSAITEPTERIQTLHELQSLVSNGIWGLGKTKCNASWQWETTSPELPSAAKPTNVTLTTQVDGESTNCRVITLQSAALIHRPDTAHFDDLPEGTTRAQALHDAYAEYWKTVSQDDEHQPVFQLVRFLAQQRLAGGEYFAHRYGGDKPYRPFVLTEPGSVFVLRCCGDTEHADQLLNHWNDTGLPTYLGSDVSVGDCPFRPQEGFGQILVDMQVHLERKPQPGETATLS